MKNISLIAVALLAMPAFAQAESFQNLLNLAPAPSARRPVGVDGHALANRHRQRAGVINGRVSGTTPSASDTALDRKALLADTDLTNVPEIEESKLQEMFEAVRDDKHFQHTDGDGNPMARRASWLYPDDGCFTRAVVAVDVVNSKYNVKPQKIFAFGNLDVKTANSPYGSVQWWYHVAGIIKAGKEVYVIDPALDPVKPTPVADWLAMMTDPNIEIALCNGDAYEPYATCDVNNSNTSSKAASDAPWYLDAEWRRLEELGRKPAEELGDNPPWATPVVTPPPVVPTMVPAVTRTAA